MLNGDPQYVDLPTVDDFYDPYDPQDDYYDDDMPRTAFSTYLSGQLFFVVTNIYREWDSTVVDTNIGTLYVDDTVLPQLTIGAMHFACIESGEVKEVYRHA